MTITQYNDLIIAISSKQAFDIQTGAIGFGGGEFDDSINPLYSIQDDTEEPRKMTVDDAKELASLLG